MSSHATEAVACPAGHGLMVPMDYEFAFAPHDGLMTVWVEWQSPEGKIVPWGYAESEAAKATTWVTRSPPSRKLASSSASTG